MIADSSVVGLVNVPGFEAEPLGATYRSLELPPDEEDEDELEELEELDDELLLDDEEDEELEELLELEDDEELDDGAKAASEWTTRLPLDAVQLSAVVPVALTGLVELAPPELAFGLSQRSVCPLPGVNETLEAPEPTVSTTQEPAVVTEMFVEIELPELTELFVAASGAR